MNHFSVGCFATLHKIGKKKGFLQQRIEPEFTVLQLPTCHSSRPSLASPMGLFADLQHVRPDVCVMLRLVAAMHRKPKRAPAMAAAAIVLLLLPSPPEFALLTCGHEKAAVAVDLVKCIQNGVFSCS